jgi:hypothetical protein
MGIRVGHLVRKLSQVTERRRAEKTISMIEHDAHEGEAPPVDPDHNPDDPGLVWEEIPDDE